jgi:Putative lumazine-binding
LESLKTQVRIRAVKIISRSLLSFFTIAVATASGIFLISSLHAANAHTPSRLNREISSGDSAEQQAVLAPITQMFDGMTKRDAALMKKPTLPGGTMVLMRDGKPTKMTFEEFADRVGKPGTTHIEERIHDPLMRIDHDLAVVWAPFEFLVDGRVDRCGTDLFNLVRTDGKWVIASVADTGRNDCASK